MKHYSAIYWKLLMILLCSQYQLIFYFGNKYTLSEDY